MVPDPEHRPKDSVRLCCSMLAVSQPSSLMMKVADSVIY